MCAYSAHITTLACSYQYESSVHKFVIVRGNAVCSEIRCVSISATTTRQERVALRWRRRPTLYTGGALRLSLSLGGSGLLLGKESASNGRRWRLSPHCLPVSKERDRRTTRRHRNGHIQMEAHTHSNTHAHTHARTHVYKLNKHTSFMVRLGYPWLGN